MFDSIRKPHKFSVWENAQGRMSDLCVFLHNKAAGRIYQGVGVARLFGLGIGVIKGSASFGLAT